MPASQSDPPTLPALAEEVKDLDSFMLVMNKLTICVNTAISEGKSVSAANKKLINLAMEDIRRSTRNLNTVIASTTPSALGEIKEELLSCVKNEMADFKKDGDCLTSAAILCPSSCFHLWWQDSCD
ncbi:unnamed protein product [Parnassius apollo]|uniref:(apollo) hypothetical protein n=1 Tax=Parnassius apollo TaxID=110799 RepID=A0A8S3W305_PARAO|nr:unnamed protein product [Parnassius apollo]